MNEVYDPNPEYGCNGERYRPWGRMRDMSRVTYGLCNKRVPTPPCRVNVRNYCARPCAQDNVGAFGDAFNVAVMVGGYIYIPDGIWRLYGMLRIPGELPCAALPKDAPDWSSGHLRFD